MKKGGKKAKKRPFFPFFSLFLFAASRVQLKKTIANQKNMR